MKNIHSVTIILFIIAIGLYLLSPMLGVIVVLLGVFVELFAWFSLFRYNSKNKLGNVEHIILITAISRKRTLNNIV